MYKRQEELSSDELLRIVACMEEHFPHSMARAVVNAAKEKHLVDVYKRQGQCSNAQLITGQCPG